MTTKLLRQQRGVASVEFPFVVVGIMVIAFGLVSIYRLIYTQARLDSTAFMLADVVARTFDDKLVIASLADGKSLKESVNQQLSAKDLLTIVQRMLPSGFDDDNVSLVIDVRRQDPVTGLPDSVSLVQGANCAATASIDALSELAPKSQREEKSLKGRTATLIQATLCVEQPFSRDSQFELSGLVLPARLSSSAVMIGGRYAL
jgi:tight adherence protein F